MSKQKNMLNTGDLQQISFLADSFCKQKQVTMAAHKSNTAIDRTISALLIEFPPSNIIDSALNIIP
ncbi:MAG: hypothetical protein K0U68_02090 [Gammaproteobacteria bacterium]|nr:hypothetical protein [Gammaproteobacteria bacterium]